MGRALKMLFFNIITNFFNIVKCRAYDIVPIGALRGGITFGRTRSHMEAAGLSKNFPYGIKDREVGARLRQRPVELSPINIIPPQAAFVNRQNEQKKEGISPLF